MHALALAFLSLLAQAPAPGSTEKKPAVRRTVEGRAIVQDSHCGGARLTEEMVARLTRPAAKVEFHVLRGEFASKRKEDAVFRTDASGRFSLKLPEGTWCVVQASRHAASPTEERLAALKTIRPAPISEEGPNPDCLERISARCDKQLEVGPSDLRDVRITLPGTTCPWNRPCVKWSGSLPP